MPNKNMHLLRNGYEINALGRSATITMYGQIVESRPWWAEDSDLFIVLKEFIDDLESLKDVTDLTVRLSSVGGDAYSSLVIHNRLHELSRNGTNVTGIVDGVAMSGGSLILCGCNTVRVNPSSIVMVHDCWRYVWDMANSSDLRKMADEMDVTNNSQAEIYVRKTGKSMEEIRAMMKETTYMSGREAVENGFADELIEDAKDPDIEVSADRRTLYACGRKMRIAAMGQLPEGIKTHVDVIETDDNTVNPETEDTDVNGVDIIPPEEGETKGGPTTMNWEEFATQNPDAAQEALAQARAEGAANERQRLSEIDSMAGVFDAETIQAAKYGENPCTAAEMAFRAAQEMAKQGRTFLNQMQADYRESGADAVGAAPATEEDNKPMTAEDRKAAGKAMSKKLSGKKEEE